MRIPFAQHFLKHVALWFAVIAAVAIALPYAFSAAHAQTPATRTAVLSWTASTTHTDGTAVVLANMTYHVHAGPKGISPKAYMVTTATLAATLTNQLGSQCYEVYAVEGNVSSDASAEVCFASKPNPVIVTLKPGG